MDLSLDFLIQMMQADKPLQFLAAAFEWVAWREYYKVNKDYGFISRLPDPNDRSEERRVGKD